MYVRLIFVEMYVIADHNDHLTFNAIDFRRQILTPGDVRFQRLKSIPALWV